MTGSAIVNESGDVNLMSFKKICLTKPTIGKLKSSYMLTVYQYTNYDAYTYVGQDNMGNPIMEKPTGVNLSQMFRKECQLLLLVLILEVSHYRKVSL